MVSTIFTFVDREASLKAQQGNQTDQALAQLYAHVQSKHYFLPSLTSQ